MVIGIVMTLCLIPALKSEMEGAFEHAFFTLAATAFTFFVLAYLVMKVTGRTELGPKFVEPLLGIAFLLNPYFFVLLWRAWASRRRKP